ncbi:aminopeptidase [Ktedonosporobacter rubrisoli]|uniref:Aminopeptidase n=1 Tax=Ktedonosporobacter rubrisoli TaxID=2509675 RepID=A0A4P6JT10_KTERU|nr:aminopeptidase [Ktedonosporobacter rubrisoli]QBD78016.1 aminopeptidase [Ktedonosporobacter rubrisoli]
MHDIRIERWAHTLVHYCLYLKSGDIVSIHATPVAAPLLEAVYREVLRVGAYPVPVISLESLEEILLRDGNDEQLSRPSPIASMLAEKATARLFIESDTNTKSLTTIDPSRAAMLRKARFTLSETLRKRERAGEYRWCITLYPTTGYAQDTDMSLNEFEEFVFDACFLNATDPIARWQELSKQQQRLVDWLKGREQVHIKAEGTDLTLSIKDRIFINSDGKRNFPSGEFFTSPVENSAHGVIKFELPTVYDGHNVEGIRLVFQEGKVIEASARQGQDFLLQMINMDEGARYLGEFAFGNNTRITHTTKNILFDEKIGGTVHLALGASYPETGGLNKSALHWDMICELRNAGEVWIDDTLFLKDGKLLV